FSRRKRRISSASGWRFPLPTKAFSPCSAASAHQRESVLIPIPRSSAICLWGFPLVCTRRTASCLNVLSCVCLVAIVASLLRPLPPYFTETSKPGQLHVFYLYAQIKSVSFPLMLKAEPLVSPGLSNSQTPPHPREVKEVVRAKGGALRPNNL